MKKLMYAFVLISIILGCNNFSNKEKLAQEDILEFITTTNLSLPKKIDDFTIVKKVEYDKNNRIVRTVFNTDLSVLSSYSNEEKKQFIAFLKNKIINSAKKKEAKKKSFKILQVKLEYVYEDLNNKNLSFKILINPEDYFD